MSASLLKEQYRFGENKILLRSQIYNKLTVHGLMMMIEEKNPLKYSCLNVIFDEKYIQLFSRWQFIAY